MDLKETLAIHLRGIVPDWIETDYENFVAFMEAYYEWLSQSGKPYEVVANSVKYHDVDNTVDEFLSYFTSTYIQNLPFEVRADKRLLIKHIKDFYRKKGNEKAIKFLFQILYNETVDFYYPGLDLLRVSDGRWEITKVIKTTSTDSRFGELKNQRITGLTSGATATVIDATRSIQQGLTVTEYQLSQIEGNFQAGEIFEGKNENRSHTVRETIYPIFNTITLVNPGDGYARDQIFSILAPDSNQQEIARGQVTSIVLARSVGPVANVRLNSFGIDLYVGNPLTDLEDFGDGEAEVLITSGAVGTYPGHYITTDSHLSSDKRLQDSYYWQDFSYVLKSPVLFDTYKDIIKSVAHPAGMIMFGETVLNSGSVVLASVALSTTAYTDLLLAFIEAAQDIALTFKASRTILEADVSYETQVIGSFADLPLGRIKWLMNQPAHILDEFQLDDPIPGWIAGGDVPEKSTLGVMVHDHFTTISDSNG